MSIPQTFVKHRKAILLSELTDISRTMHTPAHWLILADGARNLADQLHDPEAKQTMLAIAWGYDKLARHAALFADTYLSVKDGEAKSD